MSTKHVEPVLRTVCIKYRFESMTYAEARMNEWQYSTVLRYRRIRGQTHSYEASLGAVLVTSILYSIIRRVAMPFHDNAIPVWGSCVFPRKHKR